MEEENEGDERERQKGNETKKGQGKKDGQSSREATLEMCVGELKEGDSPLRIAQH